MTEVNTCKTKIFIHNITATSELLWWMGTIISKYKCTHRAEEYFTVNKKKKKNEMLSFPRELFLFLKRGPNSVLLVLD